MKFGAMINLDGTRRLPAGEVTAPRSNVAAIAGDELIQAAAAVFRTSPEIRQAFGTIEAYTAHVRTSAEWQVSPEVRAEFRPACGTAEERDAAGLRNFEAYRLAEARGDVARIQGSRTGFAGIVGLRAAERAPVHAITRAAAAGVPLERTARAEWDSRPDIRTEFRSFSTYWGYLRAVEAGSVRQ